MGTILLLLQGSANNSDPFSKIFWHAHSGKTTVYIKLQRAENITFDFHHRKLSEPVFRKHWNKLQYASPKKNGDCESLVADSNPTEKSLQVFGNDILAHSIWQESGVQLLRSIFNSRRVALHFHCFIEGTHQIYCES